MAMLHVGGERELWVSCCKRFIGTVPRRKIASTSGGLFIKSKLPLIAQAGFTALWLPPANKAAGWKSMGYDPYDYYDLGEFDQKGGMPTWFGSKAELLDLIESAQRQDYP